VRSIGIGRQHFTDVAAAIAMKLRDYLDNAIGECKRRAWVLDLKLKTDIGYVHSSDADPTDVEYYRCQVDLNLLERENLQKKLVILKPWVAAPDLDRSA
jgi:hypothetical protein